LTPPAALEAARLRRIEKTLYKVVESFSSELALAPLLDRIIGQTCELLDVPVGSIGLYDPHSDAIRIAAVYGARKSRVGTLMKAGAGMAGRVLKERRPVIEEDYARSEGAWKEVANHNVMGVPILRRRRLLGYFGVGVRRPRTFGPRDVAWLSVVARHAAIAIDNAQRFEQQKRRMERLSLITRVSHIIAAGLEINDLLRRAVLAIHRILGYANVALALVDPEAPDTIVVRAIGGAGGLLPGYRQSISAGLSGAAIRERATQLVQDVRRDPRYVPCRGIPVGARAALAIPILSGDEALGVISVEGRPPFGEEDRETLQLVAEHLAAAIRNASLFEREKVRARRLSLISRIGQITATGLNREDLLQRAADAVHELLGYANIDIPVIEPDQPDILVFGARGGEHKKIGFRDRMPISRGIIGAAVRERRPQVVNDVTKDPRYVTPPINVRNKAELAMPIIHGKRVLGVLNVEGKGPFGADDVGSLQVVSDHLAVAIHNAELHETAQRDAIQRERQRLSRDLHDSVNQLLFSMSLLAQSLGPSWRRSAEEGERKASRIVQLSTAALREMRGLIGALYPAEVFDDGQRKTRSSLPARLRDLSPEVPDGGPKVSFRAEGWAALDPAIEEVLYRVAQEALSNAMKHSRARAVEILLTYDRKRVLLTVVDNGAGFRKRVRKPRTTAGGLGLGIMQARVREQGGRFSIRSSAGRGTTVRAWFDLRSPRS
jgi:GAF domain-containing protein